jgi:hypothetical protein
MVAVLPTPCDPMAPAPDVDPSRCFQDGDTHKEQLCIVRCLNFLTIYTQ